MKNINNEINKIPTIESYKKRTPVNSSMDNILSMQMMLNRESQSTKKLHQDLSNLIMYLEKLIDKNDTPGFTKSILDIIEEMSEKLKNPVVNMNIEDKVVSKIQNAIKSIRLEQKEEIKIKDVGELITSINELKPFLSRLGFSIEAHKNISLDKESKDFLKKLENLETDAKNPIAVRLSDGKEFYKSIGDLNGGIRAMTGSSGNNFLSPTSSPTKANVDANNNLKVVQDNYTVKIEYSGANPIYIGKALPGTASSSAGWQIQKLTYSGSNVTDVQWAGSSLAFTGIWDSRAGYTYA